jgi:carbon monoxide dehydrogenase subunit G
VATFSSSRSDTADVPHPVEAVWDVLVDPDAIARMTPMVSRIMADGDQWTWCLQGVPLPGRALDLSMVETMKFTPQTRIDFTHGPLERHLQAGAEGHYGLEPIEAGTRLTIDLTISARLPIPGVARPAVTTAMAQVLRQMGTRFAANMLRELDGRTTTG